MVKEHEEILHTLTDMNQAIGARFDRVDEQFAEIRGDLSRTDQQIMDIRNRLDRIEARLNGIETRLDRVEARLERVEGIMLEDLQRRVEALEQKTGIH